MRDRKSTWFGHRLMQAAGLVLHICSGPVHALDSFGECGGQFKQKDNEWQTPLGKKVAVDYGLESVTRQTGDYCDQKIEEINPNEIACQSEENILVYKPDIQELNCWQEEPEKLHTIPRSWKVKLIQELGHVKQHGESFPVLPTIPENTTAAAAVGPLDEVAGQNEDNDGPDEADLEPD